MRKWLDLSGRPPLGTFVFSDAEGIVEAIGLCGLDFVIIDREHSPKSWDTTTRLIRAAHAVGCVPLVRVERLDAVEIGHAVDAGAGGVVIPMVRSAADVRETVLAARYSPIGQKGACPASRNAGYGLQRSTYSEVAADANLHFLLVGLIEDRAGIDNLEAIVSEEPGLDCVLLGRSDLAADLGHVGDIDHPDVKVAIERYAGIAGSSGKGGIVVLTGEDERPWLQAGMRLFVRGTDHDVLVRAYREVHSAHVAALQQSDPAASG